MLSEAKKNYLAACMNVDIPAESSLDFHRLTSTIAAWPSYTPALANLTFSWAISKMLLFAVATASLAGKFYNMLKH